MTYLAREGIVHTSPSCRLLFAVVVWCTTGCAPHAGAQETVLVFDRSSHTEDHNPTPVRGGGKPDGPKRDSSRTEVEVVLGDRRVTVREGDHTSIYDLGERRYRVVDRARGLYRETSLYAHAAFLEMELANRLLLRKMWSAADTSGMVAQEKVLNLETLFSMRAEGTSPDPGESIEDSSSAGLRRVFINGHLAVSCALSDTAFTPAQAFAFEKFLVYHCKLHPRARQSVTREARLPRSLFYRTRNYWEETKVVLTLKQVRAAPSDSADPTEGLQRYTFADSALGEIVLRRQEAGARCGRESLPARGAALRRFEAEALQGRRYLDAALAAVEGSIALCESGSPEGWSEDHKERWRQDKRVKSYFEASRWNDAKGAAGALKKLERLDRAGLEKGYIIDLGIANAKMRTGDGAGGARHLLAALAHNPCLAGAWLDLGSILVGGYNTWAAWECFDTARMILPPDCKLMLRTNQWEASLRRKHPEFFE